MASGWSENLKSSAGNFILCGQNFVPLLRPIPTPKSETTAKHNACNKTKHDSQRRQRARNTVTSHSAEGKARQHAPGENTVRGYETNPAAPPFSWPILSKHGVWNPPR